MSKRVIVALIGLCLCLCVASRLGGQVPASQARTISTTHTPGVNTAQEPDAESTSQSSRFVQSTMQGLAMILVSEMGDETFIIAAILAMKHPRAVVFVGAITALALMTAISATLGVIVPTLISPDLTHHAATLLYTFFGVRLIYIAYTASDNETEEEIKEVEEKLADTKNSSSRLARAILQKFCTPVLLEACILTFVAEWGDRSQIATITLASQLDPIGVSIGAIAGHSVCTGLAVVGGQLVARKISQRTAALCGSCLFFAFAVHNFIFG